MRAGTKIHRWTSADLEFLVSNYGHVPVSTLVDVFQISSTAIEGTARRLRVAGIPIIWTRARPVVWTDDCLELLISNYGHVPVVDLCRVIHRSQASVGVILSKLRSSGIPVQRLATPPWVFTAQHDALIRAGYRTLGARALSQRIGCSVGAVYDRAAVLSVRSSAAIAGKRKARSRLHRGRRWCSGCKHWRAIRFFSPSKTQCRSCIARYCRTWQGRIRAADPDRFRNKLKQRRQALRAEVLSAYGGRCQCPWGCTETRARFLTVDHVFNDGVTHRKALGTRSLYAFLKMAGFPKDRFRLLCSNCNLGRALNNHVCPHAAEVP